MKLPFMTYVIAFNKVSRCDPGFVTDYTYTSPGDLLNNTRSADVNEGGHIKEQCGSPGHFSTTIECWRKPDSETVVAGINFFRTQGSPAVRSLRLLLPARQILLLRFRTVFERSHIVGFPKSAHKTAPAYVTTVTRDLLDRQFRRCEL